MTAIKTIVLASSVLLAASSAFAASPHHAAAKARDAYAYTAAPNAGTCGAPIDTAWCTTRDALVELSQ